LGMLGSFGCEGGDVEGLASSQGKYFLVY